MKKEKEIINANTVGAGLVSARKEITRNKSTANVVGADDPVCPNSEGNTQSTPKACLNLNSKFQTLTSNATGITLIALVITIIVMLILVGVTVNVAINGGLFSKAEKAATETQIETDREALLQSIIGVVEDGEEIDFNKLSENLPEGFTKNGDNGIYTSKAGNTFVVYDDGSIVSAEGDLKTLMKVFLGDNFEGRSLEETERDPNIEETEDGEIYIDGNEFVGLFGSDLCLYYTYNNKAYKLTLDDETGSTCEKVQLMYEPHGDEGKKATFKTTEGDAVENGEWTILYDYGEYVEIINSNKKYVIEEIDAQNPNYPWDIPTLNEESDLVNFIMSAYNNSIVGLNKYCDWNVREDYKNLDDVSGRCLGSNPYNPSSGSSKFYSSESLKDYSNGLLNDKAVTGDLNYEQDLIRLNYFNVRGDVTSCVLASREIYEDPVSLSLDFYEFDYNDLFLDLHEMVSFRTRNGSSFVRDTNISWYDHYNLVVRPVVKISKDKLDITDKN